MTATRAQRYILGQEEQHWCQFGCGCYRQDDPEVAMPRQESCLDSWCRCHLELAALGDLIPAAKEFIAVFATDEAARKALKEASPAAFDGLYEKGAALIDAIVRVEGRNV